MMIILYDSAGFKEDCPKSKEILEQVASNSKSPAGSNCNGCPQNGHCIYQKASNTA